MKVTEGQTYRMMQSNLNRITNGMQNLQTQASTGLKLNTSSDDPTAISPVLSSRTQIRETERYLETMGHTNDKLDSVDGHMAQVENILQRVKEIAINSVNAALSGTDREALANEVAELRKELLDTANAQVNGKFIFAGYKENTKPFTQNPDYDPDAYDVSDVSTWPYLYHGDHNSTQLEITPGEFLEASLTGNEVFLGISNKIVEANGYTVPYQGEPATTSITDPSPFSGAGQDIVITPNSGQIAATDTPITIPAADLTDSDNNYAAKIANRFNQPGTGLIANIQPAAKDLGPLSLTGFDESAGDSYQLEITAGGVSVPISLNGPGTNYDYTLEGLSYALANTPGATDITATSGTLGNGVKYDISSGSLVLTGPDNGAEIEIAETITGGSGGIGTSPQTIYGQVDIAPSSKQFVDISGPGLAHLGLTAKNLDGAAGHVDLFGVLVRTEEAIRAGNNEDPNGAGGSIQAQIKNLETAANQERLSRSVLGARAQRVDAATMHQQDARTDLKKIISRYQDADIIQVYNDLLMQETTYRSALNVTGRVSQISILDYL